MLGVDPKCVAVAEPLHEVSKVNDKTWCYNFSTVKQNALFHGNHNEPQIRNMRER
jgi:hypothetical protein